MEDYRARPVDYGMYPGSLKRSSRTELTPRRSQGALYPSSPGYPRTVERTNVNYRGRRDDWDQDNERVEYRDDRLDRSRDSIPRERTVEHRERDLRDYDPRDRDRDRDRDRERERLDRSDHRDRLDHSDHRERLDRSDRSARGSTRDLVSMSSRAAPAPAPAPAPASITPLVEEDKVLTQALILDLAPWVSYMAKEDIPADSLVQNLATGVTLCRIAMAMEDFVQHTQPAPIRYNLRAQVGHYYAEENIRCFATWLRSINITSTFSVEQVMEAKPCTQLLLSLLEVARLCDERVPQQDLPVLILLERRIARGLSVYNTEEDEKETVAVLRAMVEDLGLARTIRVVKSPAGFAFDNNPPCHIVCLHKTHLLIFVNGTWMGLQQYLKPTLMNARALDANGTRALPSSSKSDELYVKIEELTKQLLVLEQYKREHLVLTQALETENASMLRRLNEAQQELLTRRQNPNCDRCASTIALKEDVETNLLHQIAALKEENASLQAAVDELDAAQTASRSIAFDEEARAAETGQLRSELDVLREQYDEVSQSHMDLSVSHANEARLKEMTMAELEALKAQREKELTLAHEQMSELTKTSRGRIAELEQQLRDSIADFHRLNEENKNVSGTMAQHIEEYEARIRDIQRQHGVHLSKCSALIEQAQLACDQKIQDAQEKSLRDALENEKQYTFTVGELRRELDELRLRAEKSDTDRSAAELRQRELELELGRLRDESSSSRDLLEGQLRSLSLAGSSAVDEAKAAHEAELERLRAEHAAAMEAHMRECSHTIADLRRQLDELRARLGQAQDDAAAAHERAATAEERARIAEDMLREMEDAKRAQEEAEQRERDAADAARRRAEEEKRLWEEEERRQAEEDRLRREREAREAEERARLEDEERTRSAEFRDEIASLGPMVGDIAAWINGCIGTNLTPDNLFQELSRGDILCQLAEHIDAREEEARADEDANTELDDLGFPVVTPAGEGPAPAKTTTPTRAAPSVRTAAPKPSLSKPPLTKPASKKTLKIGWGYTPPKGESTLRDYIRGREIRPLKFTPKALRGSAEAKENARAFIDWARTLGLREPDVFSEADLVSARNPRRVIYGLYDIARRARRIRLPRMVWFQKRQNFKYNPDPAESVGVMLAPIVDQCVCQPPLNITRFSPDKYQFGEDAPKMCKANERTLTIRVGGGWQDAREYLKTYDSCRMNGECGHIKAFETLAATLGKEKNHTDSAGKPIGFLTTRLE